MSVARFLLTVVEARGVRSGKAGSTLPLKTHSGWVWAGKTKKEKALEPDASSAQSRRDMPDAYSTCPPKATAHTTSHLTVVSCMRRGERWVWRFLMTVVEAAECALAGPVRIPPRSPPQPERPRCPSSPRSGCVQACGQVLKRTAWEPK